MPKSAAQIRRENFTACVEEAGGISAFAELSGLSDDYIRQLLKGKAVKGGRNIGDRSARKIEGKLSKPANWLDQDHELVATNNNILSQIFPSSRALLVEIRTREATLRDLNERIVRELDDLERLTKRAQLLSLSDLLDQGDPGVFIEWIKEKGGLNAYVRARNLDLKKIRQMMGPQMLKQIAEAGAE